MGRLIIIVLMISAPITTFSQGPPITTETPVMLGLQGGGIRTFGKLISKENTTIYMHLIGIPYNLTTKFQLGAIIPFKYIAPKNSKSATGLSDITLFAKYQFFKKDSKAKTLRVLGLIKHGFPTGKTNSNPSLGSGLTQTYIGLVIGRINTKMGIYGDFGYNITNKNASDNLSYNFSIGAPILPHKYPQKQLNSFLEFNGDYVFDAELHTLFLSPGLQFIPGRQILFETSFQIPIIQENNTMNKTNYIILIGTRFLMN